MTQKELIDFCNGIKGDCRNCPVHVEMECDKYQDKYRTTPFKDDANNPERYTGGD